MLLDVDTEMNCVNFTTDINKEIWIILMEKQGKSACILTAMPPDEFDLQTIFCLLIKQLKFHI